MAVDQLSKGCDDGTLLGKSSSDKLGFYGLTTPIVRPTASAAVATTVATSTSPWGFSGSTQANAIVTLVNDLRTDLAALGLLGT